MSLANLLEPNNLNIYVGSINGGIGGNPPIPLPVSSIKLVDEVNGGSTTLKAETSDDYELIFPTDPPTVDNALLAVEDFETGKLKFIDPGSTSLDVINSNTINNANDINTDLLNSNITNTSRLELINPSTDTVSLVAPDSLLTSYTLGLPELVPESNQLLVLDEFTTEGVYQLKWQTPIPVPISLPRIQEVWRVPNDYTLNNGASQIIYVLANLTPGSFYQTQVNGIYSKANGNQQTFTLSMVGTGGTVINHIGANARPSKTYITGSASQGSDVYTSFCGNWHYSVQSGSQATFNITVVDNNPEILFTEIFFITYQDAS